MKKYFSRLRNEQKNDSSYFKRFIAYIIDWYLGSVLSSLPLIILYMSLHDDATFVPQTLNIFEKPYDIFAGLLTIGVFIGYYAVIPAYVYCGQTIGKKLMKLKIVNNNYENVSAKQIFLRQVIIILFIEGSIYTTSHILYQLINIISGYNVLNICNYFGIFMTILSIGCIFLFKSKRALHDIIANTLVVDTTSNQYVWQQKNKKRLKKN